MEIKPLNVILLFIYYWFFYLIVHAKPGGRRSRGRAGVILELILQAEVG